MLSLLNGHGLKSIPLSQFNPADFGFFTGEVRLLPVDIAYQRVGWYRRALDLRSNGVAEMPYDILRGNDVVFDEQGENGTVEDVLNIFPIIGQLALDLDKYGRAYAVFETNEFGLNRAWRRLHPYSIREEYSTVDGSLQRFHRKAGGFGREQPLDPTEILYLWMPNDSAEQGPGKGVGYTALLNATVLYNKDQVVAVFLERGAINPTLVKMKGFSTLDKDEKDRVTNILQRMMSGVRNAFRITPIDADLEVFNLMQSLRDMMLTELTVSQREDISTTLGVPHSILFSNAANYATSLQDDLHFYDKTISPFCNMVLAPQLNERLFVPAGYQLRYMKQRLEVFQQLESQKADKLAVEYDRGVIDADEFREIMGHGPRRQSVTLLPARTRQPDEQAMQPMQQPMPMPMPAGKSMPMPMPMSGEMAYVTLDLSNRGELVTAQALIRQSMMDSERVEWQAPDTFHISLVMCHDITDAALMKAVIREMQSMTVRVSGIGVFNNADERALYLMVDHNPLLDALQKRVWVEFALAPTSHHSIPQMWQPHITLATLPPGVDAPRLNLLPFELTVDRVCYTREGYRVVAEVLAAEAAQPLQQLRYEEAGAEDIAEEYPAKALPDELALWERKALKRYAEGKPQRGLDFESAVIPPTLRNSISGALSAARDERDVKLIFQNALVSMERVQ